MKVFFDTNVYVAEALVGGAAKQMLRATRKARWRIYSSRYLLNELTHVLVDDFGFSKRFAVLSHRRIIRNSKLVRAAATARVPLDPKDSPILQAALTCGADYLVTNDQYLRVLDPFRGLRIIAMNRYYAILQHEGFLK